MMDLHSAIEHSTPSLDNHEKIIPAINATSTSVTDNSVEGVLVKLEDVEKWNKLNKFYFNHQSSDNGITSHHSGKPSRQPVADKQWICELCDRTFVLSKTLISHILREHAPNKPYKCDTCEKGFATFSSMISHSKFHKKPLTKCKLCGKKLTQKFWKRHALMHKSKEKHDCPVCGHPYKSRSGLYRHWRKEHETISCKCDTCGEILRDLVELYQHAKSHERKKKAFQCEVCDAVFKTSYHLTRHKTIHSGEKNFICPLCVRAFPTGYKLDQHVRFHVLGKQFKCDECGVAYYRKDSLTKHLQHSHKSSQLHKTNM